jgi:DNA (cytosine-5)-methyltransferase 1
MKEKMRSVELFAGAAGLGLGLAKAGFHHDVVVERDHDACRTIRHNQKRDHPLVKGWRVLEADANAVDVGSIEQEPDLLSGGPPCQDFSIGGAHAGASGDRNLWPTTIRWVNALRPRAFVFENVPGLMSSHADYLEYITLALTLPEIACPPMDNWHEQASFLRRCVSQGTRSIPTYRVSVEKMTATDHGTAQARSRVFVVGIRDDVTAEWKAPAKTHSLDQLMRDKWITGEYWDRHGLSRPEIDKAGVAFMRRHNRDAVDDLFSTRLLAHRTTRDAIADLGAPSPDGTPGILDHEAAPREAKAYKGHTGSAIDDPSKTLRAGDHGVSGGENMVDYGEGSPTGRYRHFTVREAARVQGFPDDYAFPEPADGKGRGGKWSSGLKQLGNAVPCELAEAVGRSVRQALAA